MLQLLVFYGFYRRDWVGIRLASYCVNDLTGLCHGAELIDAQAVDLPKLDRMFKEYSIADPALNNSVCFLGVNCLSAFYESGPAAFR